MKKRTPAGGVASALSAACLFLVTLSPAAAQESEQNLFVLGDPFSVEQFGGTLQLWDNQYEDNFFLGVGYQHFLYEHGLGLRLGLEAGVGARLGSRSSGEVWAGGVARLGTLTLGPIGITPALTAGFSVVTDTIGSETVRANALGIQAPFLYYLGPEVAVSHAGLPDLELIGRVHHRSGGFGTIAPLDGSNAVVMGLRYQY
jgi:hypothetical protein